MMKDKTAMTHLIDKILRMPESNIKGFLSISGPAYIEAEKEQMIKFALHLHNVDMSKTGTDILKDEAEQYYNETYGSQAPQRLNQANGN